MTSLWGDEFVVPKTPEKAKKIIKKISNPTKERSERTKTKSNSSLSLKQQLLEIEQEVNRILGIYKEKTQVITDIVTLHNYINLAISNGVIAIDTETNNSLQPVSCKLMGPCIYTPGGKNIYIPVNHVNPETRERLENQLTEEQIAHEFSRLSNTNIIMHNGKFDYEVIKCTCGVSLNIYWDTIIAAALLNENEHVSLKEQYIQKIDPSIEKYDIENLFKNLEYALVDPKVFALYAATDPYMTYKLYEWQKVQMDLPDNSRIKKLFFDIEIPIVTVTAEMELAGMSIDKGYAQRLSVKYHKLEDEVNKQISEELLKYEDKINEWRKTPEAIFKPKSKKPNKNGEYTYQRSKSEQLKSPPELTSPTQFAILLYDVLAIPPKSKKSPRGTGEDILKQIDIPLCKLVLSQRGLQKLIGTYIDKLPECVQEKDNRLHASFNQLGAQTGRYSSNNPNLQNIPSKSKNIRLMFCADYTYDKYSVDNDKIVLDKDDELETIDGWKKPFELVSGDLVLSKKGKLEVISITNVGTKYTITCKFVNEEV